MATYNYEIGPVKSENRAAQNANNILGTLTATNYGSATQSASEKAAQKSIETDIEYGVVRVW